MKWLLAFLCLSAQATTYYVRTDGNDGNSGTVNSAGGAWLHIGHADSIVVAGDNVRVQPGTYNERASLTKSGTSSAWINYVADGNAICRGFAPSGCSYVRIIGFEMTHVDTSFNNAMPFSGTCSNVMVLDNYFLNTYGNSIQLGGNPTYISIRGNTNYLIGGLDGNAADVVGGSPITPNHILIEYNAAQRFNNFSTVPGQYIICRNNYGHDFKTNYFVNGQTAHPDMYQPGSDSVQCDSQNHFVERNFMGDWNGGDCHFLLWRFNTGPSTSTDTNCIFRGNVAFNFGDICCYIGGIDHFCTYNNTMYNMRKDMSFAGYCIAWLNENGGGFPGGPAINGLCANTVIHTVHLPDVGDAIFADTGCSRTAFKNIGYLAGSSTSYVSTSDPLYVNPALLNFRLQSGSACRGAGSNVVYITSASSSGNSFVVNDSQLLCDGFGIVDGDTITTGGTTTTVTNINWGTGTVKTKGSVTWTNLQPVYWGTDTGLDIGAYPFTSVALTAALLTRSGVGGNIYTVTTAGDARGVWFYTNGIPSIWLASAPFSITNSTDTVTANAYALWAQSGAVVPALPVFPPQVINVNLIFSGKATASGKVLMQ